MCLEMYVTTQAMLYLTASLEHVIPRLEEDLTADVADRAGGHKRKRGRQNCLDHVMIHRGCVGNRWQKGAEVSFHI